jgi:hypothetical protein
MPASRLEIAELVAVLFSDLLWEMRDDLAVDEHGHTCRVIAAKQKEGRQVPVILVPPRPRCRSRGTKALLELAGPTTVTICTLPRPQFIVR